MQSFSITIDQNDLNRLRSSISAIVGGFDKAEVEAINHTLPTVSQQALRAVTERYALRPADARASFMIVKASANAGGEIMGSVEARRRPLTLFRFNVEPKTLGARRRYWKTAQGNRTVVAQVLRGNSPQHLLHAWVGEASNNNSASTLQVMERLFLNGRPVFNSNGRQKVRVLRGPSVGAGVKITVRQFSPQLREAFKARLARNLDVLITNKGSWRAGK